MRFTTSFAAAAAVLVSSVNGSPAPQTGGDFKVMHFYQQPNLQGNFQSIPIYPGGCEVIGSDTKSVSQEGANLTCHLYDQAACVGNKQTFTGNDIDLGNFVPLSVSCS